MVPIHTQRVYAQVTVDPTASPAERPTATEAIAESRVETTLIPTTIDGAGLWGYAALWAIVIVGLTELGKRLWLARVRRKTLTYRRVVPLFPLVIGVVSAPAFGPDVLAELGYVLEVYPEPLFGLRLAWDALWFGAPAGMAASWLYVLLKKVVWPMLPGAARAGVRTALASMGVAIQSTDEMAGDQDINPDNMGLEEPTEDL